MDEWGKIKINEDELFIASADKASGIIVRLNKEQLRSGIDSIGRRLPSYSPRHIRARKKKGLQTSVKDLNFDGGHYAGLYSKADTKGIDIASNDWKSSLLESDWGEIYGLTEENLDIFIKEFGIIFLDELKIRIRVL